jgi:BA14K-like protein
MINATRTFAAACLFAVTIATVPQAASALPVNALAIQNAAPAAVEHVQWRRGWGWGAVGAGIVAGAIIGGALSAPYYGYGPGPYYYGDPYYAAPPVVYGTPAPVAGDAVAYCMQRYRSYDPRSGTFLGYDGLRHPCP